jgi:hypothetical protein
VPIGQNRALPPAGGSENAFPAHEPTGVAAEPNIGKFYPGMRQLPRGYPAYDFVRGGKTNVRFAVEPMGNPKSKQVVMILSMEGGEWLSAKTVLEPGSATPDHITKVVTNALKDMETKSGPKAGIDPEFGGYVRVEAANPERVILHIHIPGAARALVEQLQKAAEEAVPTAGWGPGVPVEVRIMSWR